MFQAEEARRTRAHAAGDGAAAAAHQAKRSRRRGAGGYQGRTKRKAPAGVSLAGSNPGVAARNAADEADATHVSEARMLQLSAAKLRKKARLYERLRM